MPPASTTSPPTWSTRCRYLSARGVGLRVLAGHRVEIDTTNRGRPRTVAGLQGRAGPRTQGRQGDALPVRRTRPVAGAGPRLLNRSAWAAPPGGHRLSVGSRPLPQTTRARGDVCRDSCTAPISRPCTTTHGSVRAGSSPCRRDGSRFRARPIGGRLVNAPRRATGWSWGARPAPRLGHRSAGHRGGGQSLDGSRRGSTGRRVRSARRWRRSSRPTGTVGDDDGDGAAERGGRRRRDHRHRRRKGRRRR